eukprot:3941832-Rhodomonas_salina.3
MCGTELAYDAMRCADAKGGCGSEGEGEETEEAAGKGEEGEGERREREETPVRPINLRVSAYYHA